MIPLTLAWLLVAAAFLLTPSKGMAQREAEEEKCVGWKEIPVPARNLSTTDSEWKYVNVRRLLLYLESSIKSGAEWAVFEPDAGPRASETIEKFLRARWKEGNVKGRTEKEAFHVRCARPTMARNVSNKGRLICQVAVAPSSPGRFVVFRIEGQVRKCR